MPATMITADAEIDFARPFHAVTRALHERGFRGQDAQVCGPQGWILLDGRLVGEGLADWEVFEIDYDAGRAQYILRGVNRCGTALETFTWQGAPWPGSRPDHSRFGFRHARVLDERGLRVLRACGFPL